MCVNNVSCLFVLQHGAFNGDGDDGNYGDDDSGSGDDGGGDADGAMLSTIGKRVDGSDGSAHSGGASYACSAEDRKCGW